MFEQTNPAEEQKTNLVHWYPVLQAIRMRTPKTAIVYSGDVELGKLTEGKKPENLDVFVKRMKHELKNFTLPVFLRTGMMSYKHDWKNSCYLEREKDLIEHVGNIVEASHIANIAGFPFDYSFWVIREMLETKPIFYAFGGRMPITKEFRFFINNGEVQCYHPYWPEEAFEQMGRKLNKTQAKKLKVIQKLNKKDEEELKAMAKYIAGPFREYWSVDFLQAKNGLWYCIDMATGDRSYHWPECEHALTIRQSKNE